MDYSFAEFYMIWMDMVGWESPAIQMKVVEFLEDEDWKKNIKVLMLWRGLGKSTLVDLYVSYMLSKDPTLRFLILSADRDTARKSTQEILSMLRRHPLCTHLVSDDKSKKSVRQDRFFVNGSTDARNASVTAFGILSNVTGGRCDVIIADDCEVKKNSGNDGKRSSLRLKLAEATNLLVPGGHQLYIGTYHDYESIYDEQIEKGASTLKIPLMRKPKGEYPNITGETEWADRFDQDFLYDKQRDLSKNEFYSQFLLEAKSIEDSILDPDMIKPYGEEVEFFTANKVHSAKIGENLLVSCTAWWDPSLSGALRDDSVLAIVYTDSRNNFYIHRAIALGGDGIEQSRQVRSHCLRYHIPIVCVETNGVGAHLPAILRRELNGTGIAVKDHHTTERKNEKILTAFESPMYNGYLYASYQVMDGKLRNQLRDFNYKTTTSRDDFMDAVASAIKNEPVRIAAFVPEGEMKMNLWALSEQTELKRDYFERQSKYTDIRIGRTNDCISTESIEHLHR